MRFVLPAGDEVDVTVDGGRAPVTDDVVDGTPMFEGRMLNATRSGVLSVRRDEGAALDVAGLLELDVRDYHALRDAAYRLGALGAAEGEDLSLGECDNCDAVIPREADAREDADVEDWYAAEGAGGARARTRSIEPGVQVGRSGRALAVTFAPRTAGAMRPFWRALVAPDGLVLTARVVRAMGIEALGRVHDPSAIARALSQAPDAAWASVCEAFLAFHYAARAQMPVECASCGAVYDVPAPAIRELDGDARAADVREGEERAPFPSFDAFGARVEEIGREVYAERGVQNVELVVEAGVPPVDTGGTPLMGGYEPTTDPLTHAPTFRITLYYKSFANVFADEPYDVDAEIRETIDHECEHHLYHLAGHDPMDEAERAEARAEVEARFGKKAVRRAELRWLFAELSTMAKFFGAAALVAAVVLALLFLFSS